MESSKILERTWAEHDALRKRLGSLESVARRVLMDEVRLAGEMRGEVEAFLGVFREHLTREERALEPLLERTADRGLDPEALAEEHREQEASVTGVLEELELQERPVQTLAGLVMDVCTRLRRDMASQEDALLGKIPGET